MNNTIETPGLTEKQIKIEKLNKQFRQQLRDLYIPLKKERKYMLLTAIFLILAGSASVMGGIFKISLEFYVPLVVVFFVLVLYNFHKFSKSGSERRAGELELLSTLGAMISAKEETNVAEA